MKHLLLAVTAALLGTSPLHSQAMTMKAMKTASAAPAKMPPSYLAGQPAIDIAALLPPPPAPGSAADIADRITYAASAQGIDGPAWNSAVKQLNPTSPEFMGELSCAVGAKISPEATPMTFAMLARSGVDFFPVMATAKAAYKRPRPFTTDKSRACDPISNDGVGEKLGWSYPSGHSGIGWLWALVLSQAAPAHATQIRAFGQATGDLRIACRVHWLSDVAYGRVLATSVYSRLADRPEFRADTTRVAAELAKATPLTCN
ncbi:hypothetical protein GCM10011529_15750 [Polymorphobacter glacialis]|uniref:Acid phosphatase n=1 Tax=Sandarakinorhabdus glacialis TaxID=1614636 RepID=A0A916ZS13_9SPHN|nr:phosphatase PAP2 family protein [Polymorphobacter glacialis]GGE10242.1 hypothetical protein GCM10011529_15750 [Polymorphobacter glacialis]